MPTVNDSPSTIYVRDMNAQETEDFMKVKKKFGMTSNNEVVKTLFTKYLELEKQNLELRKEVAKLLEVNSEQKRKLSTVKDFLSLLESL